jgi:transcriptional regulator with XRE-family HTH domain
VEFDQARFYEAVDGHRRELHLSWRKLAGRLTVSPSTFSRLGQGRRPDIDTFIKLLAWLDRPATDFMNGGQVLVAGQVVRKDTVGEIGASFRSDPALSPEDAKALEAIVRLAYHRLRNG